MKFIIRILINAVAIAVAVYLLDLFGYYIKITGGLLGLLIVALIFGLVNALIRPIVRLFSLPITCLTLGLFTLVINAAMLLLTAFLAGNYLDFTGSPVQNVVVAFIGAIIISLVSGALNWLIPDKKD
jgi:putative membrane protein